MRLAYRITDGVEARKALTTNEKEFIMKVQAYITFGGRCEEALEFYKKSIGAEVTGLLRWKESPTRA